MATLMRPMASAALRGSIPKIAASGVGRSFATSPGLFQAPKILEDRDRGFGFVRHNPLPPKPRSRAVTEIRGPYYSVMGTRYLTDVLETMGAVDTLGELAAKVGAPMVAATVILLIGGLVSAFASTTGILAALVPLAIPLVASESVPGWALIAALGVCSSIVDVSPFSTVGATLTATSDEAARPRVTSLLARWGLSMIVIGPVLMMLALVLPASI